MLFNILLFIFSLGAVGSEHAQPPPVEPIRIVAAEGDDNLCTGGMLLFREDFGGNDPADPRISTSSVSGMTYQQLTTDRFGVMGQGRFLLTKKGYQNGTNNTSQWHIQDDHTYPDDYERGYFLEIDGEGNRNAAFYTTTINDLCPNSTLSFSAYVANVMTAGQYAAFIKRHTAYTFPQLRFVLVNPATGENLASQSTDTIPHDWSLYGVSGAWRQSSAWNLVGVIFVVPEGVESIKLMIYNDATSYHAGNDFAMDDIEIRLCMPPAEITSPPVVCRDSVYKFTVDFYNDGTLAEPIEYRWLYSPDQETWTERWDVESPEIQAVADADAGWYKVCIAGAGNIDRQNCRTFSPEFRLDVEECAPPPCPETLFIEADTVVCDTLMPFTWRGVLFSSDSTYRDTVRNSWDCETEIYRLRLTTEHCEPPCPTTYSYTGVTICRKDMPYTWRGQTISHNGWLKDTLVNSMGCDSIITLTVNMKECPPPEEPKEPEEPEEPKEPEEPESPEEPETPETPETQEEPEQPETPEIPDEPDEPETPETPDEPETPTEPPTPQPDCATFSDTTLTVCEYEMPYTFNGRTLSNAGDYSFKYTNSAGCDSVRTVHLETSVCESRCVQAIVECHTDTVCADDDMLPLTLTVTRGRTVACEALFSDNARRQGFSDLKRTPIDLSPSGKNRETLMLPIPHREQRSDYVRPDDYSLSLFVEDTCGEWTEHNLRFTVIYPSWIVVQKWNDAIALYNERYNGGYIFSDIKWFREGSLLQTADSAEASRRWESVREEGLGEHNSYIYTLPALQFGEAYWAELTREDDGKTFRTCPIYPEPRNSDISPDNDGKSGGRIRITQRTGSDGRPEWTVWSGLQCTWKVYDVLGRVCALGQCAANTGNNVISLLYPYAPGTYIVVFSLSDGTEETRKLLFH